MVVQLLQNTQNLLHQCDCRSACQNCLKHYQNQRIQMHLDRFSALKLLYYGQTGTIPAPLTIQKQHEAVRSFSVLFEKQGISLELSVPITITKGLIQKELIIQHAMEKKESLPNTAQIFISEETLQNAKPYAMKTIMEAFF